MSRTTQTEAHQQCRKMEAGMQYFKKGRWEMSDLQPSLAAYMLYQPKLPPTSRTSLLDPSGLMHLSLSAWYHIIVNPSSTTPPNSICPLTSTSFWGSVYAMLKEGTVLVFFTKTSICSSKITELQHQKCGVTEIMLVVRTTLCYKCYVLHFCRTRLL